MKFESIEDQPQREVHFVRHGDTDYLENNFENKEGLDVIPLDLTEEGIEQIKKSGYEIASRIKPEEELVVLWSSPAWRAQGSESVIEDIFREKGIQIYRKSIIDSMSPVTKYKDRMEKEESEEKIRENAGRVFNWLRYMAESAAKMQKKLHIVGVSHHEFLNPIREDIFPFDVGIGPGFQKGENIHIKFCFNKDKGVLSISASMREHTVDNIIFDKEQRKFIQCQNS